MVKGSKRLRRSIAIALLGLSLTGGSVYAAESAYTSPDTDFSQPMADDVSQEVAAATADLNYMTDAEAEEELADLEKQLADLEHALAVERGTIAVEKEKVEKEPNKWALHGDARIKYQYIADEGARWKERARISFTHDLNDKVRFNTRWALMNDNPMGLSEHFAHKINTYSSKNYEKGYTAAKNIYPDLEATDGTWVSDANLELRDMLGKDTTLTIGRFGQTFGATGLYGDADAFGGIDGAKISWHNNIFKELTLGYAKFGALQQYPEINTTSALTPEAGLKYLGSKLLTKPVEKAMFMNAKIAISPAITLHGMWLKEMNNGREQKIATGSVYTPWFIDNPNDHDVRGIGITAQMGPNFKLVGDYLVDFNTDTVYMGKGAINADKAKTDNYTKTYDHQKAEYISLRYKEAKWGDKGSFGINLDWRNISPASRLTGYATAKNDYYVMSSSMLSSIAVADDLLAAQGVKGPVVGFNYMLDKNLKLTFMQTFGNSMNSYNFRFWNAKVLSTNHYHAALDDINEKADNMTIVSLTGRF